MLVGPVVDRHPLRLNQYQTAMQAWHKLPGERSMPRAVRLLLEHFKEQSSTRHRHSSLHHHFQGSEPLPKVKSGTVHLIISPIQAVGRAVRGAAQFFVSGEASKGRQGVRNRLLQMGILKHTTSQFTTIADLLVESENYTMVPFNRMQINEWGVVVSRNTQVSRSHEVPPPLNLGELQQALATARYVSIASNLPFNVFGWLIQCVHCRQWWPQPYTQTYAGNLQ